MRMSDEAAARKALVEACIKAKKCMNTVDLRGVLPELLGARDALREIQKGDREKELQALAKLVSQEFDAVGHELTSDNNFKETGSWRAFLRCDLMTMTNGCNKGLCYLARAGF
jgi:hypothetical protein